MTSSVAACVASLWWILADEPGVDRGEPIADAPTQVEPSSTKPVLGLGAVIDSVRGKHPLLDAADASIDAARGRSLAARGAFDPRLRIRGSGTPLGGYRYGVVDTEVRARTVALGMVAFAGWRLGRGDIPVYDGKLATADGGELRAGIELPVLRDAGIDSPRAQRRKADIEGEIAQIEREARSLELSRDAALAYWDWAAALSRAEIRERQLGLALDRDAGLRQQIAGGNTAEVEGLDNARVIATREAIVVDAQRQAQVTGLTLSLFLRDAQGRPVVPTGFAAPHPGLAAVIAADSVTADAQAARARRPDLRIAAARLRVAAVDVRLAGNQRLPALGLQGYAAKDVGTGAAALRPAELGVGVVFELPIPLRTARGELAVARAVERRIGDERRFLFERAEVEIRSAYAEMSAAHRRSEIAARQASLAERLAQAERDRLLLGDSTILFVNLREEAAADAAAAAIDAAADFRKSRARYHVATGVPPSP